MVMFIDDTAVNAHNSLQIGTSQWFEYEGQWIPQKID
jgi:hypothetical protein